MNIIIDFSQDDTIYAIIKETISTRRLNRKATA